MRRIEVAPRHSEANQCCALEPAKYFYNSICHYRTSPSQHRAVAPRVKALVEVELPATRDTTYVVSWPRKSREASAICWLQGSGLRDGGRDGEGNCRNSENQKSEREKPSGSGRGSSHQSPRRLMLQRGTASSGTEDTGRQADEFLQCASTLSSASRPKADLRFRPATRENCEYALSLAAEGLVPAQAGPDTPSQPRYRHRWPAATRRRPALPAAVS